MIPRTDMVCLYTEDSFEKNLEVALTEQLTRFPICAPDKDNIIGFVHIKDLFAAVASGEKPEVQSIARKIIAVPESMPLSNLLKLLQKHRSQIALVVDEYGGTSGMVTVEDILEEIVGEIEDEHDNADEEAQFIVPDNDPNTANTWIVQALTPIEHFNNMLDANFSDDEVETMGGLLLQEIGLVSDLEGQTIELENWQFTILEADSRSIHLIRAVRQ